jgi:hypothetical protein
MQKWCTGVLRGLRGLDGSRQRGAWARDVLCRAEKSEVGGATMMYSLVPPTARSTT